VSALWQILDPACITLDLKAGSKAEALEEMVGLLVRASRIRDGAVLLQALQAREKKISTGVGGGIALPHCASPEPGVPALAMARKRAGLDFEALDGAPVRLLFLLVGQKDHPAAQLRLLSRLARLLRDPASPGAFLEAGSPEQVVELFRRAEQSEQEA
jgi:mannitol/fructose-specific phosphotransferase system IIA component (Ntr-type)